MRFVNIDIWVWCFLTAANGQVARQRWSHMSSAQEGIKRGLLLRGIRGPGGERHPRNSGDSRSGGDVGCWCWCLANFLSFQGVEGPVGGDSRHEGRTVGSSFLLGTVGSGFVGAVVIVDGAVLWLLTLCFIKFSNFQF